MVLVSLAKAVMLFVMDCAIPYDVKAKRRGCGDAGANQVSFRFRLQRSPIAITVFVNADLYDLFRARSRKSSRPGFRASLDAAKHLALAANSSQY
jgi:hypothetical protein